MSQISPPIRIVIVAAVALLGAWMLFLRPKPETVPPPAPAPATAPGVKGLTSAVDKAKEAGKTSDAANAKIQSATGEESATTAKPVDKAAAKGAGAKTQGGSAKGLPKRVQKAIDDKKVVVLFFYNPKSADDRFVKRAVGKVDRWQGEVVVQAADVKSVSRYGKIARGADVEQSPTIVVVDRNLKAEKLVGVQDTRSIDQAVVDALRNSGALIKDRYLRSVNNVCRVYGESVWTVPSATSLGNEVETAVARYERGSAQLLSHFKAVPAPSKWRGFKKASVKDLRTLHASNVAFARRVGDGDSPAVIVSAIKTQDTELRSFGSSWNGRMDKHHVLSCGTNY